MSVAMGRKPQGYSVRSMALSPEVWDRIDRYRDAMHLSSTAEAVRLLLWRVLDEVEAEELAKRDD
jgi:hypothetical protein